MNLLVLTYNTERPSFRQRIAVHLNTLRTNGIYCEVVKLPHNSLARRNMFKLAADFDGVLLHKKGVNFYDAFWLRRHGKKIIYNFDDAVMYSPKRPASDKTSHFRRFRRTVKLADLIIAGNSYLGEHASRFNHNVEILPTGLDTKEYRIASKTMDVNKIRLAWIGSKSTLCHLKEIKPALEEIGSCFDYVILRIICDDFFDLQNMKVEKCRWSLKNQALDLTSSDIGLAPLPDNRFTRGKCGFKILQYQAAALPVVSSPVGVNSEYVRNGVTGYHASSMSQWVDRISELVNNAEQRKQMGNAGRADVEKFDIDVIGEKLCDLITECIGEKTNNKKTTKRPQPQMNVHLQKHNPKVSICIPTYNRKKYLLETIDSVLAQTYKDYKIVIVDDGSSDGTEEMIRQLDLPVRYHWQKNSGDAATRNKLIELARGQYISFIDSDDLLLPDAIEKMLKAIEAESEEVIVYGSYFRIDQDGNIYSRCKRKLHSGKITKYLFQTILVHCCGSMFSRKILESPEPFDTSLKVCSDYDFWLRLSTKHNFIALPNPTFKRRRHLTNLSTASFENRLTELCVLEHFYYEKTGNKLVPKPIAMKVLGKAGYRAGCCAIEEELYAQACELLSQSFRRYPNAKSLIHWIRAATAKRLAPS